MEGNCQWMGRGPGHTLELSKGVKGGAFPGILTLCAMKKNTADSMKTKKGGALFDSAIFVLIDNQYGPMGKSPA